MPRSTFAFLNRLSLPAKVAAMSLAALATLSAVTMVTVLRVMTDTALAKAAALQETHMGVAWEVLTRQGDVFRADGDTLYAGTRALNGFNQPVDRIRELVGGTATIFRGDMRIATNVTKDDGSRAVGTPLAAGPAHDAVLTQGKPYRGRADILGRDYFTAYDPIKDAAGKVVGVLYVGIPADDVMADIAQVQRRVLGASIVITLIAAALCLWASRRMFRPLDGMRQALQRLAGGDHGSDIPGLGRQDEIGRMADALGVLRGAVRAKADADVVAARTAAEQVRVVDTVSAELSRLADGDLTARIEADFAGDYAALKTNFNAALTKLRELIGAVGESAATIRTGSGEIAQASEDLARRTEGNAASLEQTAAAISQMDARLRATTDAARRSAVGSQQAMVAVTDGRNRAEDAVSAMGRVSDSAKGIDSVIEGLDKIAFQTRVLAMNAAVEAGRAGDAGRGFAVVADLVSALAMRAEEEAKAARDQLTVTQADIVAAVDAVGKVDRALADISASGGEATELAARIAADNEAQSSAITQISAAIGTMDQATQQNAAMVEQTSAAARNLASEVGGLADQAARFKVGATAPASRARAAPRPTPRAAAPTRALATAGADDWTSF